MAVVISSKGGGGHRNEASHRNYFHFNYLAGLAFFFVKVQIKIQTIPMASC